MSIATILPFIFPQFLDNDGVPLAGGKLYSFEAGGSTPQDTYADSALTTPYSNPIILDSAGRLPGPVYLLVSPAYKFRLDSSTDVTVNGPWDEIIASAPAS